MHLAAPVSTAMLEYLTVQQLEAVEDAALLSAKDLTEPAFVHAIENYQLLLIPTDCALNPAVVAHLYEGHARVAAKLQEYARLLASKYAGVIETPHSDLLRRLLAANASAAAAISECSALFKEIADPAYGHLARAEAERRAAREVARNVYDQTQQAHRQAALVLAAQQHE